MLAHLQVPSLFDQGMYQMVLRISGHLAVGPLTPIQLPPPRLCLCPFIVAFYPMCPARAISVATPCRAAIVISTTNVC